MSKISEPGLVQGINSNIIHIDMDLWTTQAELAKKLNVTRNVVNNRVRRAHEAGTIKTYWIEQLGIRLIPNVLNINEISAAKEKTTKKL